MGIFMHTFLRKRELKIEIEENNPHEARRNDTYRRLKFNGMKFSF
jgi:hypothetical protein